LRIISGVAGEHSTRRRKSARDKNAGQKDTPRTAVIPAKAGIQYAAAYRSNTSSGILDHPLSRMMTSEF
jgi:hypothetical protein